MMYIHVPYIKLKSNIDWNIVLFDTSMINLRLNSLTDVRGKLVAFQVSIHVLTLAHIVKSTCMQILL